MQDFKAGFVRLAVLFWFGGAAFAQNAGVAGEYACVSMGGHPCDTGAELQLTANGNWRWGRYAGKYQASGGTVNFDGVGGAASWSPAKIGKDTLTFNSGQDAVVFRKMTGSEPNPVPGIYFCRTANGNGACQTGRYIEIRSDGQWCWGPLPPHRFTAVGGRIWFGTPLTGWGPADIGNGTLTFHSESGDSVWSIEAAASSRTARPDPNVFDLGCPLQPFDRQMIMSRLQSAEAPGASNVDKAATHERLAQFCTKVGDTRRAQEEAERARYWKNGGHW